MEQVGTAGRTSEARRANMLICEHIQNVACGCTHRICNSRCSLLVIAPQVYKYFGLETNTIDFVGHAVALYTCDESACTKALKPLV